MIKTTTIIYKTALAVGLLCPLVALSQPAELYFKADAGGNLTEDTELKQFFGPVTAGSKVKFDPGARIGFGVGYRVCEWFAVEGEVGAMANDISSITEATRVDAVFSNVPFLVNARFQCPRHCRITPYIGGGAGVSASILDVDRITLGDNSIRGSAADAVFAYQGFAGLQYFINDTMALGIEYRYFATESPRWDADVAFGTETDRVQFGGARTHSLSVAFKFRF